MNDLTPAEQAAAEALADWHSAASCVCCPLDFAREARAVVAAVRPLIEAEARDAVAAEFDRLAQAFTDRQSWSAARAAKYGANVTRSLSRPTSEETQK